MAKIKSGYLAPTPRRMRKLILDGGVGAMQKILEICIGEVVWPHPPETERHGLHGH